MRPLFFVAVFDVLREVQQRDNDGTAAQRGRTSVDAAHAGAMAQRLQAQHLLDVCGNQLRLQMTFSHKICDVDAVVEGLLDAVV